MSGDELVAWVEQHLDVTLAPWQRAYLERWVLAPRPRCTCATTDIVAGDWQPVRTAIDRDPACEVHHAR